MSSPGKDQLWVEGGPGSQWVEIQLTHDTVPGELYEVFGANKLLPKSFHHFWDEPWHPGRYVVRVLPLTEDRLKLSRIVRAAMTAGIVETWCQWDASPDEILFGAEWRVVCGFFNAGSAVTWAPGTQRKLVHCFLNAQGLSVREEFFFALRFAWDRLRIGMGWYR
jgi:hypothetical protein